MARQRHTKATIHLATRINRNERRITRQVIRQDPELVENRQPRGRAIYDSY